MPAAGERIHEQLAGLTAARFTAAEVVRLAPRWWHLRAVVRADDDRWAQLNRLASAVLSLLRATAGGVGAEPVLPAQLRAAIHRLTAALGALAANPEAGASEAVIAAPTRPGSPPGTRHSRAVDRFDHPRLRTRPLHH